MFKKFRKNEKGFTLAELLIVEAIIGVLVAISIPIFTSQLEKSRDANWAQTGTTTMNIGGYNVAMVQGVTKITITLDPTDNTKTTEVLSKA